MPLAGDRIESDAVIATIERCTVDAWKLILLRHMGDVVIRVDQFRLVDIAEGFGLPLPVGRTRKVGRGVDIEFHPRRVREGDRTVRSHFARFEIEGEGAPQVFAQRLSRAYILNGDGQVRMRFVHREDQRKFARISLLLHPVDRARSVKRHLRAIEDQPLFDVPDDDLFSGVDRHEIAPVIDPGDGGDWRAVAELGYDAGHVFAGRLVDRRFFRRFARRTGAGGNQQQQAGRHDAGQQRPCPMRHAHTPSKLPCREYRAEPPARQAGAVSPLAPACR
ncbi:MAG: hypothetical protein GWN87_29125 [Desulfuromonadales bacterium]|nr:hypothetical protein [Desulfuromonadales bacterium]